MSQHNATFKAYFISDGSLSFEGLICCHYAHIRNNLSSDDAIDMSKWFNMYSKQARIYDAKAKGQAKKAWNELVFVKAPTSKKRSYFVANTGKEAIQEILRLGKKTGPAAAAAFDEDSIDFDEEELQRKLLQLQLNSSNDESPDFAVQVRSAKKIISSIGEVKGAKSCHKSVSLNTYRLGLFGLNMLWKYGSKNSLAFQIQSSCDTMHD
ncbi:hypothetical protein EDC96DRAFT_539885 [Choanephora cucurbitarum]|nr:hypothetical protein EDC96DRAFT_539885 [Choanephora cucurbitarum]